MRLIIEILFMGAAVAIAAYLLPGVDVENFWSAIIAGILIALANATIGTILRILTFPINFLTLGLVSFIITVLMVLLVDNLMETFNTSGFFSALLVCNCTCPDQYDIFGISIRKVSLNIIPIPVLPCYGISILLFFQSLSYPDYQRRLVFRCLSKYLFIICHPVMFSRVSQLPKPLLVKPDHEEPFLSRFHEQLYAHRPADVQ
jgi:putative membrane protein